MHWFRWNGDVGWGDVLTALYLAATACIFLATRSALALTRESVKEMKATRRAQNRSIFEGTFFQMLRMHRELLQSLMRQGTPGQQLLVEFIRELESGWKQMHEQWSKEESDKPDPERSLAVRIAAQFFSLREQWIAHYFHSLYHILVHIETNGDNSLRWYAKILRAQLTTQELALLFYFCLSPSGAKLKQLVEEFGMLEDLTDANLIDPAHRSYFAPSAFDADYGDD